MIIIRENSIIKTDRMEKLMEKRKEKRSIIGLLLGFMDRVSGDHVGAYATQAAYFLIMSFIPCILFLTTLVRYTPLSYNVVRDAIIAFIPENLQSFVLGIVVDVYKRSTAIVPLSALLCGLPERECSPSLMDSIRFIM